VAARLQHFVTMADQSELAQIAPGVPVFLYGFPGRLNKAEAPEATFIKGDIGRVTGFDQKLGDFGRNTLLQHSAYSTGGTSGSPMFNSSGHVIGINAGGYVENGQSLAGYNFGMRIDLVHSLYPLLVAGS
jgi:S1-C subfamily serine protease